MSIISQETDDRYPLAEQGADTTVSMSRTQAETLQRAAYTAGATRTHTREEIEAAAKALYETWKPASYPQWEQYRKCARYQDYTDAAQTTLAAARQKATDND